METKISKKLKEFVESFFGKYNLDFSINTSVENDLDITGEDGVDFIKEYSEVFDVDISKFVFSDYFHPEPSLFSNYRKIKPLTLGDLDNGIKKSILLIDNIPK